MSFFTPKKTQKYTDKLFKLTGGVTSGYVKKVSPLRSSRTNLPRIPEGFGYIVDHLGNYILAKPNQFLIASLGPTPPQRFSFINDNQNNLLSSDQNKLLLVESN